MQYEPLPVFHPHTMGDYLVKGISQIYLALLRKALRGDSIQMLLFLEASISMFAMSEATHTQYDALSALVSARETIEDLLAEASGAHFRLLVGRRFAPATRMTRFCIWKQRAVQLPFYRFLGFFSTRISYRVLAQLEEQAYDAYLVLEDKLEKMTELQPAGMMAITYWELPENATQLDAVRAMIVETRKNRELDHQRANEQ